MNQELKNKWVAALRSGEYKQGKFKLRDENGRMCCLAVLGTICGLEITSDGDNFKGESNKKYQSLNNAAELTDKESSHFVGLNDCEGRDFNFIADYIEANL